MTFGEFIHVAQFYETIICFSILVLIGQRLVMMLRNLDQKYLKTRARQFDDQMDWEQSFAHQKKMLAQQLAEQKKRQQQAKRIEQQRRKQQQQNQQPPKQQGIKTSLVQNEHETTDRRLQQGQQYPQHRKSVQRKSLTQLRRSQQHISQQARQIQIKDQQSAKSNGSERRGSTNSVRKETSQIQRSSQGSGSIRNKTINIGEEVDIKTHEEPSINPQDDAETEEDRLQKEYKEKQSIRYFTRVDAVFNQYLPILMSVLVVGIMCSSTYIFTMVCFFGFMFASLLFNYANLLSKLKNQPTQTSIFSKINKLISGIFILALFVNYWADDQF